MEQLLNTELETVWKAAVVAEFNIISRRLSGVIRETPTPAVSIAGGLTEMSVQTFGLRGTEDVPGYL